MQRFIDASDAVDGATMLHARLLDDGTERLLFRVVGDREPYVEALSAVESVLAFDVTGGGDDGFYIYVVQETREADRQFREALRAESLLLVPPVEYRPDGVMRCSIVGAPEDLRCVLRDVPEDVRVDVDRVGEFAGPVPSPEALLTDRQRAAVAAAVEAGYYEVPRDASLEEVADRLGCASSTVSEHLRRAEARVMRRLG
jgi:hypothetical protein